MIKEGIAATARHSYAMVISSDDYYKSNVDRAPWTFYLPPEIRTEEQAEKFILDLAKRLHLKRCVGTTDLFDSIDHVRYDREDCKGYACYRISLEEYDENDMSTDEFVSQWLADHPANKK